MLVLINLLFIASCANAARILGIVPAPSYSHQIAFKPLWRELSLRGHHVTTITSHPMRDPKLVNLTEIDISEFAGQKDNMKKILNANQVGVLFQINEIFSMMVNILDQELGHPPIKKLINDKGAKFDLVIGEYLWYGTLAFAERFNCPYIGMLSVDAANYMYKKVGSPTHSSLYADGFLPFGHQLSLSERVINFIYSFIFEYYMESHVQEMEQKVVDKHFGSYYPPLRELSKNISMLFVNSDPIFHPIRPLVPAVVQIGGGSHANLPTKPLPKELKSILDKATNGFVYFSLGSNVLSEYFSKETINMIIEMIGELPYTVVWKFGEEIPNKPKNLIISKWLPQQEVLRHPNIKVFITQGGLQSMDEAIFEHVPMIGIPFFGDQPSNVKKMVAKGFGLELNHKDLNKKVFKEAILEIINNPKYRNTVKKLSELAQDQPMTGVEKAVWWSEYVIRHNGAKHLRSPLLDIPWYQYLLLDVIGVLLLTVLLFVYLVYFIFRFLIRLIKSKCCNKRKPKEKKS